MAISSKAMRLWRLSGEYILAGVLTAVLLALLVYPILLTVKGGFTASPGEGGGFTLRHFSDLFADPRVLRGLVNSLTVASGTTILAILIAMPLAVIAANYRFPGKSFFSAAILVPMILPPFVGAIGVRALIGREGAMNAAFDQVAAMLVSMGLDGSLARWFAEGVDVLGTAKYWGVVFVQAFALYPIIFLNTTASLANLDPALNEAAENLGAGPWRRFFRITLPLVRPGLFAGSTIVFIWSFTELGTPLMFDYYAVTPVQIFYGLKEVESSARPYALTVVLLSIAIGMYILGKSVFGRKGYAMYSKASRAGGEVTLTGWLAWAATAAFGLVTMVAVLPHTGVILSSLTPTGQWYASVLPESLTVGNYKQALSDADALRSIGNSLKLSFLAMAVDIGLGILIAYVIVRSRIRGKWILDSLCMMPLAVPGLVMAFGYVAMSLQWPFGKQGPLTQGFGCSILAAQIGLAAIVVGVVQLMFRDVSLGKRLGVCALAVGAVELLFLAAVSAFDLNQGGRIHIPGPSIFAADPNPFPFLIAAYSIRRLPYIVRSTVAGLEQTSGELEEAAINLGASRVMAVRRVIVPLILANIIAGGLLVFSFSMLEVSDSLILAQQSTDYPLTKAIWTFADRLGDGAAIASAMGVWGMALLAVTLFAASSMLGKKMGSIFRV